MYETLKDLKTEQAVCDALGWDTFKLDDLKFRVDRAVLDKEKRVGSVPRVNIFAEIKRRHNESRKYKTLMISYMKWIRLKALAEYANVKSYLIIAFDDGIFQCNVGNVFPAELSLGLGNRTCNFRNEKNDKEPCVYIPIHYFKKLVDLPETIQ